MLLANKFAARLCAFILTEVPQATSNGFTCTTCRCLSCVLLRLAGDLNIHWCLKTKELLAKLDNWMGALQRTFEVGHAHR
ncbi:hypothetical protein COCSUDRAFT_32000 [Coccomyxa subellipsoidea C-169]|uniref:Secreted protein n=1 Tax=Coccomyxa subellipsoidea (strain C-169) TaxID=574566 RepID=I0Z9U1_COCSC|nr:hypothetical protein COCSUDRAFT_32000 [Coccomyxa subellipsoidea C-169]EIE27410.1 hypothetical protein COCSUDRAFT_32000 [Coccomyxa subellipsoidea C-169]|eukprot:XP_005651954.1 hypothetical protein COCSUDRAFT_32000 [Coccomyxa subellipsoidea C-169]